ncbi:YhfG family protein [Alcanivorax hongdengensis]|uniref:YhfG family protein n=1 Tax=Alcanivorax hongdengensis TaxID=519051 RepID=UPI00192C5649|nr:YhfG family protein [Alcanivorax hongdengensis]
MAEAAWACDGCVVKATQQHDEFARGDVMISPSLKTKRAYFASVRRRNYAASLRLEGFDVPEKTSEQRFSSKEEAVRFHSRQR